MKTLIFAAIRCSLTFTAVVGFFLACPAKANLITNSGFETGDFTGWTVSGFVSVAGVEDFPPHSGNFQARSVGGTLGQTLATIPGDTYFVSFWWTGLPPVGDSQLLEVTWGGDVEILVNTAFPVGSYTHFTFSVPATSASTELQFKLVSLPAFLDDVSVSHVRVGVPDSGSTFSLLGCALLGLATLRRKLGWNSAIS